ncbi:MAG: tetratricopeptide repeat protein [Hyphomicrobiaceae bacterium]
MVDRNDSFLREVNEELRREQFMKLWERFGVFAVAGVILLFVGVGVYKWNESSRIAHEQKAGARFEAAMQLAADGKAADAQKAFDEIAKDGPAGYAALARLRGAAEHVKAGRTADALAAYEALAAGTDFDPLLRDFATLQAAMLRLDQADWTEMKNRLTPLLDDNQAWHAEARELLGVAALKAGRSDEATKLFEQLLGDRATTAGMSRRVQELLAVLTDRAGSKGGASAPATPAGEKSDKAAPPSANANDKASEPATKN